MPSIPTSPELAGSLLEMVRQLSLDPPILAARIGGSRLSQSGLAQVEILAPLLVADEHRGLHRGDQVALPAGVVRMLIDDGLARAAE